jgi:uncharacterized protein YbjT (DUF2867 family)
MKPRVLIVGATGRTGGSIVNGLLDADKTVRVYIFLSWLTPY